jgi:hypothetical protein
MIFGLLCAWREEADTQVATANRRPGEVPAFSFWDINTRSSAQDFLFDELEEFVKAFVAQKFQPLNFKRESVRRGGYGVGLLVNALVSHTATFIIVSYTPKVSREI